MKLESDKRYESERAFETILKIFEKEIPKHEIEYRFHEKRKWRFDFAWPDKKVAVEVDGGQWNIAGGRHNRDSDRDKINEAVSYGWLVLRFSTTQLNKDPYDCIEKLKRTLSVV